MLSIQFLGAAGTVTGSRYAVTYGSHKFLVDCGMFQGPDVDRNALPSPIAGSKFEAALLTHAHIDHSGMLPRLVAEGFRGPIFCTFPTRDLCDIMLPDSAKIQEQDSEVPIYDREDALDALEQMRACEYDLTYDVVEGVTVRFRDSGHILGSAWLELTFQPLPGWPEQRPIVLVFSGDVGRGNGPLLEPADKPTRADFLVLESTYGNRLHPADEPLDQLADIINEITDNPGVLVIPAFAVQRTQELALMIEELWLKRRIDPIDVFIDSPLAVRSTRVFEEFPDYLSAEAERKVNDTGKLLGYKYLHLCETVEQSRAIDTYRWPVVIISASGMVEGGRVLHHLKRYLPDTRAQVLLAGYQCEGTRGHALQNGATELELIGRIIPVRAKVSSLEGMSGHADYRELGDWLSDLESAPQRTFLIHGDPDALQAHKERITERSGWNVEIPDHQQEIVLISSAG
jgi:metallo-beta-lactamase family protein